MVKAFHVFGRLTHERSLLSKYPNCFAANVKSHFLQSRLQNSPMFLCEDIVSLPERYLQSIKNIT